MRGIMNKTLHDLKIEEMQAILNAVSLFEKALNGLFASKERTPIIQHGLDNEAYLVFIGSNGYYYETLSSTTAYTSVSDLMRDLKEKGMGWLKV